MEGKLNSINISDCSETEFHIIHMQLFITSLSFFLVLYINSHTKYHIGQYERAIIKFLATHLNYYSAIKFMSGRGGAVVRARTSEWYCSGRL